MISLAEKGLAYRGRAVDTAAMSIIRRNISGSIRSA
jgi:hypothetical protein